jgi:hypothetical protein
MKRKELEEEIKGDEAGVADFEQTLFRLGKKKKELEGKIKDNEQWRADFRDNIGPFEKMYQQLVDQIHSLYGDAKVGPLYKLSSVDTGSSKPPGFGNPWKLECDDILVASLCTCELRRYATEKHAAGVQILMDEFAYHPAYKRWDDQFTATPFKPA